MPRSLIPLATAALIVGTPAAAEMTRSANVGFVSDYVFRGISQSDENVALQGGFDLNLESGPYLGVWGSSVDFNDGDEASLEADLYAGFASSLPFGLGYDVGAIYYAYPGADSDLDYDFYEVYGKLNYAVQNLTVSGGLFYSPEFFGDTGQAQYYFAAAELAVGPAGLFAHLGRQEIDDAEDYNDWKVGLSGELGGFVAEVAYHDTDLDNSPLADERLVVGLSRAF